MKILIVKTSSLGDVIHTLPALTDAGKVHANIHFDWVVEKPFSEVPLWHPLVNKVVPVEIRRWRRHPYQAFSQGELSNFFSNLRVTEYDYIIDAQGLVKSALLARMARGKRYGLDWYSAWEPMASLCYQKKIAVNPELHAIHRVRALFGKVFGYEFEASKIDYGIDRAKFFMESTDQPYVLFLHGTTWETKHWPELYWQQLALEINQLGFTVKLPWGNSIEKLRAERIAAACERAEVLPKLTLAGIAKVISGSRAVVAVDTGLGHITAALSVPAVSLYGPTDPEDVGTVGENQVHLEGGLACNSRCTDNHCVLAKSPELNPFCFIKLTPDKVVTALAPFLVSHD